MASSQQLHQWKYQLDTKGTGKIEAPKSELDKLVPLRPDRVAVSPDARWSRALHGHFASFYSHQTRVHVTPMYWSAVSECGCSRSSGHLPEVYQWGIRMIQNLATRSGYPAWLADHDLEEWKKGGPTSIRKREFWWGELYNFYLPRDSRWTPRMQVALEKAREHLWRQVPPRGDLGWVFEPGPNGTNVGLMEGHLMQNNAAGALNDVIKKITMDHHGTDYNFRPAVTGARIQPKDWSIAEKNRLVWMVARAPDNADMLGYVYPWNVYVQSQGDSNFTFCHLVDMPRVEMNMTRFTLDRTISVDFSQYDSHFVWRYAAEVVKQMALPYFKKSEHDHIMRLVYHGLRVPLMVGKDVVAKNRTGGMPSGLGFTNWVDSLYNLWAQFFIAETIHKSVEKILVNGDDGLVEYDTPVTRRDVDAYSSAAMEINLVMHPKKCVWGDRMEYLRLQAGPGVNRAVYPLGRALHKLMFRERKTEDFTARDMSLRNCEILENLVNHPHREAARQFVVRNDKYYDENIGLWDPSEQRQFHKRRPHSWLK